MFLGNCLEWKPLLISTMAPVSLFPAVRATLFGAAVPGITTINQDLRNPI